MGIQWRRIRSILVATLAGALLCSCQLAYLPIALLTPPDPPAQCSTDQLAWIYRAWADTQCHLPAPETCVDECLEDHKDRCRQINQNVYFAVSCGCVACI